MPWCDRCSEVLGAVVDERRRDVPSLWHRPRPAGARRAAIDGDVDVDEKAPWHFKVMVVALVVYLVYRFGTMFFG